VLTLPRGTHDCASGLHCAGMDDAESQKFEYRFELMCQITKKRPQSSTKDTTGGRSEEQEKR
jgi:hypothetical protein